MARPVHGRTGPGVLGPGDGVAPGGVGGRSEAGNRNNPTISDGIGRLYGRLSDPGEPAGMIPSSRKPASPGGEGRPMRGVASDRTKQRSRPKRRNPGPTADQF